MVLASLTEMQCPKTLMKEYPKAAEIATIPLVKITNINRDWLGLIFNKMSLVDVINLADSCTTLKETVKSYLYAEYIRIEKVRLHSESVYIQKHTVEKISDFKVCLQFLRQFGQQIKGLSIDYDAKYHNQYTKIYRYLNDYCSEIEHLTIDWDDSNSFNLQNHFKNVKSFTFSAKCRSPFKKLPFSFDKLETLHLWIDSPILV